MTPSYCYTVNYIVFPGESVLTVWECRWEPVALCPSGIEVVDSRHYHLLWSETLKLLLVMRLSSFPTSDVLTTRQMRKHLCCCVTPNHTETVISHKTFVCSAKCPLILFIQTVKSKMHHFLCKERLFYKSYEEHMFKTAKI